ncbi:hypothetical protein POV27_06685 [Aureisphaera galaxeae]|uniref:hypothetical protein n=1 Tax=Aureisphaera galaxeae TaxID=1538023 RepID=UPI00234FD294|nr:hypothetical protein [Aureisphaera galaxeae]MDC8003730.1 hypothetical protein [Aureisphaera galaxeae]
MSEKETKLAHLDHLQQRMEFVSAEANSYSNKYLIGGIIAIIGLLNIDLVMEADLKASENRDTVMRYLFVVIGIGVYYFRIVGQRILRFEKAYRKTKFKYETVLYHILDDEELAKKLETGLEDKQLKKENITFEELKAQHAEKLNTNTIWPIILPALLIMLLTIIAKIFHVFML